MKYGWFLFLVLSLGCSARLMEEDMPPKYTIVPTPPLSELRKFALWFHQDWKLDYGDFRSGLELFLDSVSTSTSRRAALAKELREFLDANAAASSKSLTRQWFKLGAGGTDPDQDIRDTLEEVYRRLQDP
jgi:hypothetical protein